MNDSDNKSTKVIIGIIIAILLIIVAVYAYSMLKDENTTNDMTKDMNNVGQDMSNGAQNMMDNAGNMAGDIANGVGNVASDVAEGTKDVIDNVIDFTMTDNAEIKDNIKTNTSEKIKKDKKYEDLIFKEVTLVGRDNATTFTAKIKNNAKSDFVSKDVTITFYKNDTETITRVSLNIPDIKAGDTTEVTVSMAQDVANASDYVIE